MRVIYKFNLACLPAQWALDDFLGLQQKAKILDEELRSLITLRPSSAPTTTSSGVTAEWAECRSTWPKPEFREVLSKTWLYFERSEIRKSGFFSEEHHTICGGGGGLCEITRAKTCLIENFVSMYT